MWFSIHFGQVLCWKTGHLEKMLGESKSREASTVAEKHELLAINYCGHILHAREFSEAMCELFLLLESLLCPSHFLLAPPSAPLSHVFLAVQCVGR